MRMNSNIIMRGQQPNFLNALASGHQAGRAVRGDNLYREHGAGIASGDQNALNALAQFDPQAALQVQSTQQNMAHQNRRMEVLNAQEKRAIQARAMQMSVEERQQQAQRIQAGMMQGLQLHQQGDLQGLNMLLAGVGEQPIQSLDQFPAVAVKYKEVYDSLTQLEERNAGPQPVSPEGKRALDGRNGFIDPNERPQDTAAIQALKFRAAEAGLTPNTPEYAQFMLEGGRKQDEMRVQSDGKGGFTFIQGAGAASQEGGLEPSSPEAMMSSIEGILNDPALDTATGLLSVLQSVPGTPQYRFGTRVRQLQGQAFLQAFESLKGAGQITEVEGTKATEAIGRLDSAQSPKDYRAALNEILGVLQSAQGRPQGWATQQAKGDNPSSADITFQSDEQRAVFEKYSRP